MATHLSAKKRIRQIRKRRLHNRYYARTARKAINNLRMSTDKESAKKRLSEVVSLIDKLAKMNIIHKNKASNLKSELARHVNKL